MHEIHYIKLRVCVDCYNQGNRRNKAMKDNTRIELINKEIETFRKFAVVLESLKPVIQSFDGKCINKKFAEAMDEFLFYGKNERKYHVSVGIDTASYESMFDLRIRCYDDSVKGEADSMGYSSCFYISNRDFTMRVKAEEVTTTVTVNGKPRINAKALIEKLDEKIQQLHNKAEELKKDLSHIEEMRAELEQIQQMVSTFREKYHERIVEVFNCNYFLKDNNGMQYR